MITRNVILTILTLTWFVAAGSWAGGQDHTARSRKIFQQEPDTPVRLVRAADTAARLHRIQLARGYLKLLLDQSLSTELLLQLRDEVGIKLFLSLNANADLQPAAGEILRQINAASSASLASSDQTASLIAQLGENRQQAVKAATALLTIGNPAARDLLAADIQSKGGGIAFDLLQQYPREFRYGILDALPNVEPIHAVRGLQLLAATSDSSLAPLLLEYEYASDNEAVRSTASLAVDRLWNGVGRPGDRTEAVEWLTSQAATLLAQAADRFSLRPGDSLKDATRYAEIAVAIDDGNRLVVAATMQACRAASSADDIEEDEIVRQAAIDIALKAKHGGAAAVLLNADSVRLRRGMYLPDAVVRVKAASELLKLNRPVRGISYAQKVIRVAANGSTDPEAVVIDSRQDVATLAMFLLDDQGYQAARTSTGQAGFEQATRQLNCELILVHSNCLRWSLSQTVANVRADSRTARTPIAIYGPSRDEPSVRALQQRYPGISYLPGPLSEINFVDELRRNDVPVPLLTEAVRSRLIDQARAAEQI
ncbi:MAG: hypothetical protein MK102_13155 [Fuerstiella sp.]|nr:hypothetical protein [Fuerstiella sp.]